MAKRRLTLNDFLLTSYGQTPREVRKDYRHYMKTGEVFAPTGEVKICG